MGDSLNRQIKHGAVKGNYKEWQRVPDGFDNMDEWQADFFMKRAAHKLKKENENNGK